MESWFFLGIILLVAILAKNQSLMVAAAFVLIMKLIPTSRSFFPWLQGKGINIGVTIITAAILIPIATGEIGLRDLLEAFKSPSCFLRWASGCLIFQGRRIDCF